MMFNTMSDNADFSVWSNEEIDILDNLDKEVKLVSSGSESDSNQVNHINGELWKVLQENEPEGSNDNAQVRQSELTSHSKEYLNEDSNKQLDKLKLHHSSNDLQRLSVENTQSETVPNDVIAINHSISCNILSQNENEQKYAHAESKRHFKVKIDQCKAMSEVQASMDFRESNKEEYLEEINKRLEKELEEKNALLTKLQENYENLLLKYAEAQNKIDQLRLKSVCKSAECQTHSGYKQGFIRTNLQLPINIFASNKEHQDSWDDVKCQKAVVAPFMKDEHFQEKAEARETKIERPSSLALDTNVKNMERDAIKAGTPTDSEGVSSVITSMSGHSKILNTLEVQSPNSRDSKLMNYPERDFILADSSVVNDAFDKVKNWQNSLPPLELIETPETTLYDESPIHISPSTNYHMPPSPKEGNGRQSGGSEDEVYTGRNQSSEPLIKCVEDDDETQAVFKEYLRTLTLPTTALRKKNLVKYPKRSPALEVLVPGNVGEVRTQNSQSASPKDDVPSACIIQRRKKPPLLRCSSLPAYECDSPRSANRNVYIPPLDLENLTLSDVESSQVEYEDYDKTNRATSSSYITSQSGSMEFSSHTYRNVSNFKSRISDYTDSPYSVKPSFNKSTSITPDRCKEMNFPSFARTTADPKNLCKVCGENFAGQEPLQSFPFRSTSYQSFHDVPDSAAKSSERRGKYPFNRSVSFNSENRRCFHGQDNCFLNRRSHDSLEKFDIYANNLKARSQVIMKALAAHVNNT